MGWARGTFHIRWEYPRMKILHSQHPACLRSRTTWNWMYFFSRADSCASSAYLVERSWLLEQFKWCTNLFFFDDTLWKRSPSLTRSLGCNARRLTTPQRAKPLNDEAGEKLGVDRHERGRITCYVFIVARARSIVNGVAPRPPRKTTEFHRAAHKVIVSLPH